MVERRIDDGAALRRSGESTSAPVRPPPRGREVLALPGAGVAACARVGARRRPAAPGRRRSRSRRRPCTPARRGSAGRCGAGTRRPRARPAAVPGEHGRRAAVLAGSGDDVRVAPGVVFAAPRSPVSRPRPVTRSAQVASSVIVRNAQERHARARGRASPATGARAGRPSRPARPRRRARCASCAASRSAIEKTSVEYRQPVPAACSSLPTVPGRDVGDRRGSRPAWRRSVPGPQASATPLARPPVVTPK